MNISDRIAKRMRDLKLRSVDIVKLTGVSKGTVSQWVNGVANPGGENLHKLAIILKCDVTWLLYGKGDNPPSNSNILNVDVKGKYPLISMVQAGSWSSIDEIDCNDAVFLPCPVSCSSQTFILRVAGISMEPRFKDGDLIYVDPLVEATNKKYVVARLEDKNEATFKQLIIEGEHRALKPLNENWIEKIIPINENTSIVGVVVYVGSPV